MSECHHARQTGRHTDRSSAGSAEWAHPDWQHGHSQVQWGYAAPGWSPEDSDRSSSSALASWSSSCFLLPDVTSCWWRVRAALFIYLETEPLQWCYFCHALLSTKAERSQDSTQGAHIFHFRCSSRCLEGQYCTQKLKMMSLRSPRTHSMRFTFIE